MHLSAAPPQPVPIISHFDYVAVDAERRRVYAAHTRSNALMIVNADTGQVLGQVDIGQVHGVAFAEKTGTVYTGDESGTVSAVNPVTMQVTGSLAVGKPIDAIAYDPTRNRIYADEDSGNQIFVIDAAKMRLLGTVTTPGDDHEFLAVDPSSGEVYQNIPGIDEFVVINPASLQVIKAVRTKELKKNHPLQFYAAESTIVVGGKNGVLSVYDRAGKLLGSTHMPMGTDQCDLDQKTGMLACAAEGTVSLLSVTHGTPKLLATLAVGGGAHTVAIDPKTGALWTVERMPHGDYVQRINPVP